MDCITCGTPRRLLFLTANDDEKKVDETSEDLLSITIERLNARESFKNKTILTPKLSLTAHSSSGISESSDRVYSSRSSINSDIQAYEPYLYRHSTQMLLLGKNKTFSSRNAKDRNDTSIIIDRDEEECRRLLTNIHITMDEYTDADEVFANLSELAQRLTSSSDVKYRTLALNDQSVRDKFCTFHFCMHLKTILLIDI